MRRLLPVLLLSLAGCATVPAGSEHPGDPWEPYNRAVYEFNDGFDRYLLKPATETYVAVTPALIQTGVSNFFANLDDVRNSVNNLLQGRPLAAGSDLLRLALNTTLGIGGLVDVASEMGLRKHNEDFGQTLGVWGVGSGPYFMLPFLGPSSVRDTAGLYGDYYASPTSYLDQNETRWGLRAVNVLDVRASVLKIERVLGDGFHDRYATLRDAYLKRRESQVRNGEVSAEQGQGLLDELKALEDL